MFQSTRIKLTCWYLLIIMMISAFFSLTVYNMATREIERIARKQRFRIEQGYQNLPMQPPPGAPPLDADLGSEIKLRIAIILALINSVILTTSAFLGYFLAGKTLKPIQNMLEEQNRFIANASHDLRTPLTALKSSLEVFLRDPKATITEARELIKDSITDVDTLSKMASSLLQLAQYQNPDGTFKFEKINSSELITKTIDRLKPLIKTKNLQINQNLVNCEFMGNKICLQDMLTNILDNAIKYSLESGTITITTEQLANNIIINIKDEGVGIDEKDLPHIFDRFYRADIVRGQVDKKGYGLGLAIVKSIVLKHKGKVTAESILGKGTTIIVTLPIIQAVGNNSGSLQKSE